jgi:hypothetical protein
MTPRARTQGWLNALLCGAGFLVFWGASAVAISLIFDQSLSDSLSLAGGVLLGLSLLAALATWCYGRAAAGRVLLDCGRHPGWSGGVWVLGNIMLLVFISWDFTEQRPKPSGSKALAFIAGILFLAALALSLLTGRLQVRENGIWGYWRLLRWARIGSYLWADDYTLVVRPKSFRGWFQWVLPVPPEHRQAVTEFLAQRCSTRAGAEPVPGADRPGE